MERSYPPNTPEEQEDLRLLAEKRKARMRLARRRHAEDIFMETASWDVRWAEELYVRGELTVAQICKQIFCRFSGEALSPGVLAEVIKRYRWGRRRKWFHLARTEGEESAFIKLQQAKQAIFDKGVATGRRLMRADYELTFGERHIARLEREADRLLVQGEFDAAASLAIKVETLRKLIINKARAASAPPSAKTKIQMRNEVVVPPGAEEDPETMKLLDEALEETGKPMPNVINFREIIAADEAEQRALREKANAG